MADDAHSSATQSDRNTLNTKKLRRLPIDESFERFPYCLVWTPLPVVTWLCPLIGHTGIANSKGVIYDFSDDFDVTVDNFSFGTATKYYQFDTRLIKPMKRTKSQLELHADPERDIAHAWDKAIEDTTRYYVRTRHSIFFNNCHQYISTVLNKVHYAHRTNWTQTEVCHLITFRSKYVGFTGFIRQWWPFLVILFGFILLMCLLAG